MMFSRIFSKLIKAIPQQNKLVVLMYHKISLDKKDPLTVTLADFAEQMQFLKNENFKFLTADDFSQLLTNSELINGDSARKKTDGSSQPQVLITFDDGYQNNAELLFPWLTEQKIPALVFLPLQHLGKSNHWDGGHEQLMSVATVKKWISPLLQFGLHSYAHENYKNLSANAIAADLEKADAFIEAEQLQLQRFFAYPYGGYPKQQQQQQILGELLRKHKIKAAFRIGNRHNSSSFTNPFALSRLDIRGNESFNAFVSRVRLGKLAALFL